MCVFQLGRVANKRDAEAISALVGSKMVAVVTNSEVEKEELLGRSNLSGLTIVSLAKIPRRPENRQDLPRGARLAVDLVIRDPQLSGLWQELLRDSLVFESEDALVDYKARHGYGRYLVAPKRTEGWRVVKGMWEVAGESAFLHAIPAVIPITETDRHAKLVQRERQLASSMR
jgi:chromosome segregation ATPase